LPLSGASGRSFPLSLALDEADATATDERVAQLAHSRSTTDAGTIPAVTVRKAIKVTDWSGRLLPVLRDVQPDGQTDVERLGGKCPVLHSVKSLYMMAHSRGTRRASILICHMCFLCRQVVLSAPSWRQRIRTTQPPSPAQPKKHVEADEAEADDKPRGDGAATGVADRGGHHLDCSCAFLDVVDGWHDGMLRRARGRPRTARH
jgi:hypothetical protein